MSYVEVFPKTGIISLQSMRVRVISDSKFVYPNYIKNRNEILNVLSDKLITTKGLKKNDYRVALCIFRHMNNKSYLAFPSRELMAKELDCSTKTVDRAVNSLFHHKVVYNQRSTKGRSTYYYIEFDVNYFVKSNKHRTDLSGQQDVQLECGQQDVQLDDISNNSIGQHDVYRGGQQDVEGTRQQDVYLTNKYNQLNKPINEEGRKLLQDVIKDTAKNKNLFYLEKKEKDDFKSAQYNKFNLSLININSSDKYNKVYLPKLELLSNQDKEEIGQCYYDTKTLEQPLKLLESKIK